MPTYEYRCDECGDQFDIYQSFTDDALTTCPLVHGPEGTEPCGGLVKKVFGNVGVSFKGSGFYKTDSRSSSGRSDESSTSKSSDTGGSSDKGKSSDSTSSADKKSSSSDSKSSSSDSKSEGKSTASAGSNKSSD